MANFRVKNIFLMKHFLKYLIFTALLLATLPVVAQSKSEEREERKKARTELRESLRNAKAAPAKGGPTQIFENPDDNYVAPENAPYLDSKEPKLYHIRKVNIHGVKYLNHDILRSASKDGLPHSG